ncbi:cytochrome c oxidase subunit II [SAR86 cluster bacterium]|jgi:cytochrome c oxidase subunit 2|nr:cytochrome c oxidase subunit II [SAR86 cluster bacterium]
MKINLKSILTIILGIFAPLSFSAWSDINMEPGATQLSQEIFGLHMFVFYVCLVIGVIVLAAMAFILFQYRRKEGVKPAEFDDSKTLELTWTILFALILIGLSIPATKVMIKAYDDTEGEINILITGHQWKWQYEYIEDEVGFFSNLSTSLDKRNNLAPKDENYLLEVDEPLIIPVNTRIRFLITANDVIHSWWVPDFAIKQDAIPGFVNTGWTYVSEPGVFRGQCTELCGQYHGYMPIVVKAVSPEEYESFIIGKKEAKIQQALLTEKLWEKSELVTIGEDIYQKNCVACHQVSGAGLPPIFPALVGSDIVLNGKERQIEILMEGVQGAAMASYAEQLTEVEIAAVITYTRQAWGNDEAGDGRIVLPKEILDYKNNKL